MANSPSKLSRKGKAVGIAKLGKLYTMRYYALDTRDYPYFDLFPTVLVMDRFPGGFAGLNFNYISHERRVELLKKMNKFFFIQTGQKFFQFRKFRDLINTRTYRDALVCARRYRYAGIQSQLIEIDDEIWEECINRCDEKFVSMNRINKSISLVKSEIVWRDTLQQARGR